MTQVQSVPVRCEQSSARERRDQIVLENLALVRAIAVRVQGSLPVHVELDDLVHAGILGLMDAADKYDSGKQVVFQTYAKHRIKGAILDSLREADWASRDMRKRQKKVESFTRDFTAREGHAPSDSEIADEMGVEVERWRKWALELSAAGPVSTTALSPDGEETITMEFPAAEESQPDQLCAREEMKSKLAGVMQVLPERYRKVVFLYYSNDMSMKEIGAALGVNESRVSQIHKLALEKLAAALHSEGIHSSQAF